MAKRNRIKALLIALLVVLLSGCAKEVEKAIPTEQQQPAESEQVNKYIMCSTDSDCTTREVDSRKVDTGARIITVPLYVCLNKEFKNLASLTKEWALRYNVQVSDMLEQKCVCIRNACEIIPIGVPPQPK